MKAFSFLHGSKKTQQQHQQRQQQGGTPLSINITARSSQDYDPFYLHQIPTARTKGIQSPAYSTISFFSSKSSTSRAGSGANTPEPSQAMHASDGGSGWINGGSGKSRPSLTLLRPRMSSDSNHHPSAENSQKPGGGRLNIYNRFGFSKSSSQLPHDLPSTPTYPSPPPLPILPVVSVVSAPSSTETVTPNRQYQLLHQQMFPETAPVESSSQPFPPAPKIEKESSPTYSTRDSLPKTNTSVEGREATALNDPASTSIILQRRRAKSLGHANSVSAGHRIPTALKIPTPVVVPAPPLPPSRASSTKSSPIPRPVNVHLPPPIALMTVLPPTPMSSASSLTSESAFNLVHTSTRMRSESTSTRSRSESNSSRARSESNSSSASSSRHGHGYGSSYKSRSSKTATMGRLDDFWDGFLKEIDEDMTDLCVTMAPVQSAATTPTRPARLEDHDLFLGPEETIQTAPLVSRPRALSSPRRKATAKLPAAPTSFETSKSRGQTITMPPKSELRAARSLLSPPLSAPLVTIARSPDISPGRDGYPVTPFKTSVSQGSISSLPYLNSPGSSLKRSPDPSNVHSPQTRGIQTQNSPTFARSLSPANICSLDPSLSQPTIPQPATQQHFPQEPPSPSQDSHDSRPGSTYSRCSQASQFSQFSLSLFPSPPSVPLVRPTTENGTFRTGRVAPPPSYRECGQMECKDTGVSKLRFKPIVASTRAKPHVRAVLFERDENGHAVLSMPLTAPRFASNQSDYSSASSSSASSAGTGTYVGPDSFTASSHIGTTPVAFVDPSHRHLGV